MLVGHNTSSTSILIEWKSPPVLQQNGILIGYYIQWKEFCTNTLINELPSRIDVIYIPNCNLTTSSITNSTNTKDTSFQINGLHPFTNYEITVLANTSVGGGPSVTVTVISDQDGKLFLNILLPVEYTSMLVICTKGNFKYSLVFAVRYDL